MPAKRGPGVWSLARSSPWPPVPMFTHEAQGPGEASRSAPGLAHGHLPPRRLPGGDGRHSRARRGLRGQVGRVHTAREERLPIARTRSHCALAPAPRRRQRLSEPRVSAQAHRGQAEAVSAGGRAHAGPSRRRPHPAPRHRVGPEARLVEERMTGKPAENMHAQAALCRAGRLLRCALRRKTTKNTG